MLEKLVFFANNDENDISAWFKIIRNLIYCFIRERYGQIIDRRTVREFVTTITQKYEYNIRNTIE